MGLKDVSAKNFFGNPEIMAELADCVLFGGRRDGFRRRRRRGIGSVLAAPAASRKHEDQQQRQTQ